VRGVESMKDIWSVEPPAAKWGTCSEKMLVVRQCHYAGADYDLAWYDHETEQWRNNYGPIKDVISWMVPPSHPKVVR